MANVKKRFKKGLILSGDTVALDGINGELKYDSSDHKFKATANSVARELVDNSTAQTLTNKSIDADDNTISDLQVGSLKAGVLNTSTSLAGATNAQIPSALAVKTYVDDQIDTIDQAAEITYDNSSSGLTATNVQAAIDEVDVDVDDLNLLSGVAKNAQNLGTFTGSTIPDNQTNKQALQALETSLEEIDQNANDLISLSGVAENATTLGTFTGTTIPDSSTVKAALQSLETSLETKESSAVVAEIDQNVNDLITLSGVAENATSLGTFTGTTIPDSSTVKAALQALETSNELKLQGPGSSNDNRIVRWDGTSGNAVQNSLVTIDDAGAVSGATQLDVDNLRLDGNILSSTDTNGAVNLTPNGTGIINANKDTRFFQDVAYQITSDTATGANATLTAPPTKIIRLTNSSLTSLDGIPAGSQGQQITIINSTGNSITVNDNTGGTAANRILTGQKANITLKDEASLILEYDDTETRWMVIGGTGSSGSAGINYVSANPDYETAATGYTAYADAAGVVPVDATGGSPVTAITRSTSSPLRGAASGLWSKSANNRQGEGFAYAITLDTADQGKMQELSFDYTTSANYVDGDMRCFIYDVTNSVLIEPTQRDINANSGQAKYRGFWQAPSNSTSYRVVWHVATTSALAYDFKLDNVYVGPSIGGAPNSNIAFKLAKSSSQTISTTAATKVTLTEIGSTYQAFDYGGGADPTNSRWICPESGLYWLNALISTGNTDAGSGTIGMIYKNGAMLFRTDTAPGTTSSNANIVCGQAPLVKGDIIEMYSSTKGGDASYAVSGNGAGADERSYLEGFLIRSDMSASGGVPISFKARITAGTQSIGTSALTKISFDSVSGTTVGCYNKGGAFNTVNTRFEAPEAGTYFFSWKYIANTDITTGAAYTTQIRKNGTGVENFRWWADEATHQWSGHCTMDLIKGDYVEVFNAGDASYTIIGGDSTDGAIFEGFKINNPSVISPSEFVGCYYESDSGNAITSGGYATYEDKVYDTHGMMRAGFQHVDIPVSGKYQIITRGQMVAVAATVGNQVSEYIEKNGSSAVAGMPQPGSFVFQTTTSIQADWTGSAVIDLVKGDVIRIINTENVTPAISRTTNPYQNYIMVTRIK